MQGTISRFSKSTIIWNNLCILLRELRILKSGEFPKQFKQIKGSPCRTTIFRRKCFLVNQIRRLQISKLLVESKFSGEGSAVEILNHKQICCCWLVVSSQDSTALLCSLLLVKVGFTKMDLSTTSQQAAVPQSLKTAAGEQTLKELIGHQN